MKSFVMFLIGVATGIAGTYAYQKINDQLESSGQESLADRLQENLDALEERIASIHLPSEASA